MDLSVSVHIELSDQGEPVWWAECQGVPGFYAAAPDLLELRARASIALEDILAESGEVVGSVSFQLADDRPTPSSVVVYSDAALPSDASSTARDARVISRESICV